MEPEEEITDGSGSCTVDPEAVFGGVLTDLTFTVTAADYLLESVRITLPEGFEFPGDAEISGAGFADAVVSVEGNVVTVTQAALEGANTGTVVFYEVTPPNITNSFPITVETAVPGGTLTPILVPPLLQVVGDLTAMAMLHQNDADGVPELLGQTVILRGIVTVNNQFGSPAYVQDETGGVAVYDWDFAGTVELGDDVEFYGTVTHWNGLVGIQPATIVEIHSSGNTVEPVVVTCHDIDFQSSQNEPWEGMLVRINNVTTDAATWSYANFTLTDASGSCTIG
jgi:hypothetical protein